VAQDDMTDLAREVVRLDSVVKAQQVALADSKRDLAHAKETLLGRMAESGTKGLTLDTGAVTTARVLGATVTDEEVFMLWAQANGVDRDSYRAWSASKLRSFMVEHVEEGTPLPDGVQGYEGVQLRIRHRKGGQE